MKKLLIFTIALCSIATISFAQTAEEKFPAPDDFVAVEKAPTVDLQELSQKIVYPDIARRSFIEGRVLIQVLIDKTGKPLKNIVLQSANPLLDSAAINAVMFSTYTPAIQSGNPIACWIAIPVTFKLRDPEPLLNTNTTEPKKEMPVPKPK
jgi:TonB family protein